MEAQQEAAIRQYQLDRDRREQVSPPPAVLVSADALVTGIGARGSRVALCGWPSK